MDRQAFRRTIAGTGLLFKGFEPGNRKYLGSCFIVMEPTVFVTAAHCIKGVPVDELWVNHHGGPPPNLFTRVQNIEWVYKADIAVFETESPESRWAVPFQRLKYVADFGEEICAFGYPEAPPQNFMSEAPAMETPRFFRGNVQRPFGLELAGRRYSVFELSFPCPPGLSGGPVFLAEDPTTVIGVVTGNFETVSGEKNVIMYGVAANIFNGLEVIEKLLGRRLPDPEPECYP